jgi:hypothetical protein
VWHGVGNFASSLTLVLLGFVPVLVVDWRTFLKIVTTVIVGIVDGIVVVVIVVVIGIVTVVEVQFAVAAGGVVSDVLFGWLVRVVVTHWLVEMLVCSAVVGKVEMWLRREPRRNCARRQRIRPYFALE